MSFEVLGPYDKTGFENLSSRDKIFKSYPAIPDAEEEVARNILSNLARLADRRPLNDRDMKTLNAFYEIGHEEGGFEAGIQFALE